MCSNTIGMLCSKLHIKEGFYCNQNDFPILLIQGCDSSQQFIEAVILASQDTEWDSESLCKSLQQMISWS